MISNSGLAHSTSIYSFCQGVLKFKDKDGAYRIYIGKQITNASHSKNKEKVRVDYYPAEKKIVIRKITEL